METVKSGREMLVLSRVGQQIAGELPRGKLVKGEILVERFNDPVAVGPHRSGAIHLVAVGIGITCNIEPVARHAFSVAGRGEEAIDDTFVGAWLNIRYECISFSWRGRQTSEVERDSANELRPVCLRGRG